MVPKENNDVSGHRTQCFSIVQDGSCILCIRMLREIDNFSLLLIFHCQITLQQNLIYFFQFLRKRKALYLVTKTREMNECFRYIHTRQKQNYFEKREITQEKKENALIHANKVFIVLCK